MRNIIFFMATIVLLSCSSSKHAQQNNSKKQPINMLKPKSMDTDMFPEAKKEEKQHIITLPTLENEQAFKVEVFVTKTMKVDCNHHSLSGQYLNPKGCRFSKSITQLQQQPTYCNLHA